VSEREGGGEGERERGGEGRGRGDGGGGGGHALGAGDLEIWEPFDDALFNLAPFETLTLSGEGETNRLLISSNQQSTRAQN
jgi:hypothetical protein